MTSRAEAPIVLQAAHVGHPQLSLFQLNAIDRFILCVDSRLLHNLRRADEKRVGCDT